MTDATHKLSESGYFNSTNIKIPDSVGYDPLGVMGEKPKPTWNELENERENVPLARDPSKAEYGESGQTRYQELVQETKEFNWVQQQCSGR